MFRSTCHRPAPSPQCGPPRLSLALFIVLLGFATGAGSLIAHPPGNDLFDGGVIPRLRIEIAPEGMEILRSYVWDKKINGQDRTNVLATVREGNQVYTNVAVHLKGGLGSYRPVDDKPALTLTFDRFAPGQTFHGLEKIYLNNSVQDPSYLSEKICREMFLAAGLPSPRAGHAVVTLNQRNLGLYVLLEGWNKQFLKQHFQGYRGTLYDGGYGNDVTNRLEINSGASPADWAHLQALGRAAQESVHERLARMAEVLDLDRFLTFMAMEVMLGHWDGYSMNRNNFRVFDDPGSGRLVFLPHGMDQMFGVFRSTPISSVTPHMRALVSRAVMEVPEGRARYFERMSQLLTNVFRVELLTNRVQQLAAEVRPALGRNPVELVRFNFAVAQLTDRMVRRADSVARQLREPEPSVTFTPSGRAKLVNWKPQRDSGNPSFSRNGRAGGVGPYLEIRATGGPAYGSWRTTVLLDAGEYQFRGRARIEGLRTNLGVTRGGVTLRMSGERAAKMVEDGADWQPLTYDFKMPGQGEIELVCELRASDGRVWFDLESLELVRKNGPAKTILPSGPSIRGP